MLAQTSRESRQGATWPRREIGTRETNTIVGQPDFNWKTCPISATFVSLAEASDRQTGGPNFNVSCTVFVFLVRLMLSCATCVCCASCLSCTYVVPHRECANLMLILMLMLCCVHTDKQTET